MAIHVELKTERCTGRDAQVTQTKLFINEIKVIMKAFALVKLEKGLARCFIMPWPISIALFHGRKDVNQSFGLSGLADDLLNAVIFAESSQLTNEFNLNAMFTCDALSVCTDLFCKGLGEI